MPTNLPNELDELQQKDPAVAAVIDAFVAADRIYQVALKAMGLVNEGIATVRNSAEITLSIEASISTSRDLDGADTK